MMENMDTSLAIEHVRSHVVIEELPRLAIILGSGWGPVVDEVAEVIGAIPYGEIPGFPVSTVSGHAGRLVYGRISGTPVWIMQGRFHYYEGYSMQQLTFPVRVLSGLGIGGLVLTNAAGGIEPGYEPGQLMLIEDHINLMGANPLRGPNDDSRGTRFPDMTQAWDLDFLDLFRETAKDLSIQLNSGVYLAVSGPNFETPAEVRAFFGMGAQAVGMSTVPECIVARHENLRVAGLSCITNVAAHAGGSPLTHEEVSVTAQKAQKDIASLFTSAIPRLHQNLKP